MLIAACNVQRVYSLLAWWHLGGLCALARCT